ncbi:MAG: bifunctional phosphoribosyl-AMP cyclohydrolase/phosphoribosyl-ATP diphosphatase HisIE, partial [Proteobacteria bacterium]
MIKNINAIDFNKSPDGLIPVVVQDNATLQVLMLGYMNKEALEQTITSKKVTFFSRSKQRLWVKGETSKNYLLVNDTFIDCDNDTILVMATPCGPTCHTGNVSCFSEQQLPALSHIGMVDKVIQERIANPTENSYTHKLISRGLNKVAQKVGEEAVEVVIAALAETR